MNLAKLGIGIVLLLIGVVAVALAWGEWSTVRAAAAEPQEITLEKLIERGPDGPAHLTLTDLGFIPVVKVSQRKSGGDEWAAVYIPLKPTTGPSAAPGVPLKVIIKSTHFASEAQLVEFLGQFAKERKLDVTVVPNNDANLNEKVRTALKEQSVKEKVPETDYASCLVVEDRYQPGKMNAVVFTIVAVLFLLVGSIAVLRGVRGDIG